MSTLSKQEICERLDVLVARAKARIPDPLPVGVSAAEIMWMTDDEASERAQLVAMLPSIGQERRAALQRLSRRHPRLRKTPRKQLKEI